MLAFMISSTSGQGTKWEAELQAGFNISTMSGQWGDASRSDDNTKHKWIGTPNVGVGAAYNFTPIIALVAGLYMIKSGLLYKYSYNSGNETFESTQRERYTTLRVPIMARFMWGTTWQYYGLIGFYVSKRLCGKYVYTDYNGNEESGKIKFKKDPDSSSSGDDWILDTQDYRRLNLGLSAGAGIRRALGPGYLSFAVLFGMGFFDFNKWENKDDRPDGYKPFNDRNLSFNFGYTYAFGSKL